MNKKKVSETKRVRQRKSQKNNEKARTEIIKRLSKVKVEKKKW